MINIPPRLTGAALLCLAFGLGGCSNITSSDKSDAEFATGAIPPADQVYALGVARMQRGDYARAAKDFQAIEETYPYSTWATHAELLEGYAQYKNLNYDDAVSSLERFIELHPENQDAAYAYYLKALCFYERIDDVQRDQSATYQTIAALNDVITRFPDSAYAHDARIKLRLAYNRLAGHDMAIGRYYEKQHLYAAAVGRYQDVVNNYATTTYAPEALERLTEVYLDLGLSDAALRAASVLGYNYPGSTWYQAAYAKLAAHGLAAPETAAQNQDAAAAQPQHHWYWPF